MDDKFKCPKCGKDDRLVRHIFNTTEWHTCAECGFDAYSLSEHYKAQQAEIADLKRLIRWAWELRTGARKPDIQDPQYSLNLVLFNQVAQEFKEG